MSHNTVRKPLALAAIFSSAVAGVLAGAPAANATNAGVPANSPLTISDGTNQVTVVGGQTITAPANVASIAWSVKGDRFAYIDGSGAVFTAKADGSHAVKIADAPAAGTVRTHPAWGDAGFSVVWSEKASGKTAVLVTTSADGSSVGTDKPTWTPAGYTPGTGDDTAPEFSGTDLVFQRAVPASGSTPAYTKVVLRTNDANGKPMLLDVAGGAPGAGAGATDTWSASQPTISPDGKTVAYVQKVKVTVAATDVYSDQLFTVSVTGGKVGTPQQVTFADPAAKRSVDHEGPAFSADGKTLAFAVNDAGDASNPASKATYTASATVATGATSNAATKVSDHTGSLAYDTALKSVVQRFAGADRFQTAILASQSQWRKADNTTDARPQANVAVLSRSDLFADALGGAALAGHQGGPLLLTETAGLNSSTATELTRTLKPGSTVYLLGGTSAISPAVETAVKKLGFTVSRVAGANRFDTAVRIAQKAAPNGPDNVFVATGDNFADALSAGAAAANDPAAVVVLTDDKVMPTETKAYLGQFGAEFAKQKGTVQAWTVGGQADAAFKTAIPAGATWYRFPEVGADRFETSYMLAHDFFGTGMMSVGLATGFNFPDALSGGAVMGNNAGPLLLVDPAVGLTAKDLQLLADAGNTTVTGFVFGGKAALPTSIDTQLGNAIAGGAGWGEGTGAATAHLHAAKPDATAIEYGVHTTPKAATNG